MKTIDLNAIRDRVYKNACDHGFHDEELSDEHLRMMIITEIAEVVEADRKGRAAEKDGFLARIERDDDIYWESNFEAYIKDCIEDEISDVIIRLLDFAGVRKVDIEWDEDWASICERDFSDNEFVTNCFTLTTDVAICQSLDGLVLEAITFAKTVCGDDWLQYVEWKMRYNEGRPRLNGKAY